jgi:hypothetical protein
MNLIAALVISIMCVALPDIVQVRAMYSRAPASEKNCKALLELLNPISEKQNPLLGGYKGCATMIMAKHAFNPFTKLSYFNKGKKILEQAVATDTSNVELRYLRFTIQTNSPTFLGYNGMLAADRSFLLRKLPQVKDASLSMMISTALKKR